MTCRVCGRLLEYSGEQPFCRYCADPSREAVRPGERHDRFSHERPDTATSPEPADVPSVRVVRPVWVYLVAGVYLTALLALLLTPLLALAGGADRSGPSLALLLFVGILFLLGLSLLVIPIGAVNRRPAGRTPIVVTIIGSSLCAAVLVLGGGLALAELARPHLPGPFDEYSGYVVLAAPLLVWLIWVVVFSWLVSSVRPLTLADRAYQWLLGGSVLELLVAILSHIVVRRRDECCAGIDTGIGIILGTAIMFVALGPGVFFLFYRRYQQVYRRRREKHPEDVDG